MKKLIIFTVFILPFAGLNAHVTLPAIFSDHMVLQQRATVTIWGWAKPFEVVTITGSWNPQKVYSIQVGSQAEWSLDIETPPAGGPYTLSVKGYNTIEILDVLIGEVWLGSGQSNMEWTAAMGIDNAEEEISRADFPQIRFFTVYTSTATCPQQHLQGAWVICNPESMKQFSALMYFFGRELHREMEVPVGLINSSWGGTPVEIWMPPSRITGHRLLEENARQLEPVPWGPIEPGRAYHSMIHPLIPFRIKGALWYQGEANTSNADHYATSLATLIESWRNAWGYDFPFYYVQIAPWEGYGSDNVNGAKVRDQQRKALALSERTGMVVVSDIGNLQNIHPGNKQEAGKRLAAWALHYDYGRSELSFSGPLLTSWELEKNRIFLHFDYTDNGLISSDGELREFEVLDPSGRWVEAKAYIRGNLVEVEVSIEEPWGIRYAFRNDSQPNLFNGAGLPASCFEELFYP